MLASVWAYQYMLHQLHQCFPVHTASSGRRRGPCAAWRSRKGAADLWLRGQRCRRPIPWGCLLQDTVGEELAKGKENSKTDFQTFGWIRCTNIWVQLYILQWCKYRFLGDLDLTPRHREFTPRQWLHHAPGTGGHRILWAS